MNQLQLHDLLWQVAEGKLSPAQAEKLLHSSADLGFACLDLEREQRCGFPEVIYGAGKTAEQISQIMQRLSESTENSILATRCSQEKAAMVQRQLSQVQYNETAKLLYLPAKKQEKHGLVAVFCAGTSDLPVAEEAAMTAELMGAHVQRVYDVGVSGLHRLLAHQDILQQANVIVVAAGMDGALPSVIGGLTASPVIAVPTSVGYGASFAGVSALLSMLNSCASGIAVVNIDNGFGAGYMAAAINKKCK